MKKHALMDSAALYYVQTETKSSSFGDWTNHNQSMRWSHWRNPIKDRTWIHELDDL